VAGSVLFQRQEMRAQPVDLISDAPD